MYPDDRIGSRCACAGSRRRVKTTAHRAQASIATGCRRQPWPGARLPRCQSPRAERRAAPLVEGRRVRVSTELAEICDGEGRRTCALGWTGGHCRQSFARSPHRREHRCARLVENVNAIERLPRTIERGRIAKWMLKGKRRKGLAVPASPRFLARVVEGQELLETRGAGIAVELVVRAALRAHAHLPWCCAFNVIAILLHAAKMPRGEGRRAAALRSETCSSDAGPRTSPK